MPVISEKWRKRVLSPRVFFAVLAVVYVSLILVLKASWISVSNKKAVDFTQVQNEKIFNLFQTSFYFSYDDQFKPGIQDFLKKNSDIRRIEIISEGGQVIFDSKDLQTGKTVPYSVDPKLAVHPNKPLVLEESGGFGVLFPVGQYSIYYAFSLTGLHSRLAILLVIGLAVILALFFFYRAILGAGRSLFSNGLKGSIRLSSLRSKFIGTILVVNVFTAAIVFTSLSYVQKKEQTDRIIKESILFSEFSTENVISSFSNFFYFYYQDKFVPAVRRLISSNENLALIRIISKKSGTVVFDSEEMLSGAKQGFAEEGKNADLSESIYTTLKNQDIFYEIFQGKDKNTYLRVISAYRNDNQETPFFVEFHFSFATLNASVMSIRKQILIDLIPSMALGVVIAILFSQLVVGPIKRLVFATQSITSGNYDVSVQSSKKDELGDLIRSFNAMAEELKRKNGLKKYLSDQSYRRIVEAPEGVNTIGGARIKATVLFCDIRNFVSACETMDAEEVTSMLNEYFSNMVEVIYKHKGEVDKFIGDAILAVFYEQEDARQPVNTALHAIYCAMEMRERLAEFNAKRVKQGKPEIEIGVGINSGEIISGPIGSPDRMDFTVIGDTVNIANRIEKLSKQGKYTRIVFSGFVEEKVRGLLEYEELTHDKIRGKEENVTVFELIKIRDVSELLSNLSHPDAAIKRHCIELLGYSSNASALKHLYPKLSDSDENVRIATIAAITRLASKNSDDVLNMLFQQMEQEGSVRVLSTIIISLGKLCKNDKILKLTPYLQHRDERIVANTIESIAGSENNKVIDLLIPFLASKSNRIKANAAMVLFSKGRVEVLEALKPMLLNSDAMMRASAAFALGELTSMTTTDGLVQKLKISTSSTKQFLGELQSTVPLLVSLLKDADPIVKKQAIVALGKIKDKSAVLPLLDNLDMHTDNKEMMHDLAEALRSIGSHRLVREVVRQLV